MALEVQRSSKEEPKMDDQYEVTERLALTEDGRAVPEGDPDARWLYAIPGQRVPLDEARRHGLVSDDDATVGLTEKGESVAAEEEAPAEEPTEEVPAVVFPPEVKRGGRKSARSA